MTIFIKWKSTPHLSLNPGGNKFRDLIALCFLALLSGCGGINTAKPVYQGLLAEGVSPKPSTQSVTTLSSVPSVAVVLTESSRETIRRFREPNSGPYVVNYPVDRWIANLAAPLRQINPSITTAPDLSTRKSDSWVVLVHWVNRVEPFVVGATVEYHVLDNQLAQVAVFKADKTGSCDDWSINFNTQEVINRYVQCYDRFVTDLIKEASSPMLSATGH